MSEVAVGRLLLEVGVLLATTWLVGGLLERLRIPAILGALLVAMTARALGWPDLLTSPDMAPAFGMLADLGVLFLLFFIGLQIDPGEMRRQEADTVLLTVLNTAFPFVFGVGLMLALGYGWVIAFVVGLTRMPTAEAVIVPILDEFDLIRTRIGEFVIGAGILDDVIEVFLVAFVSVWIGEGTASTMVGAGVVENEVGRVAIAVVAFLTVAGLAFHWIIPLAERWLPVRPRNLVLLSMVMLFGLGGEAEATGLGTVVGAIVAGVVMRPAYDRLGTVGGHTLEAVRAMAYGLFGFMFFFWIGLSVDLGGLIRVPRLAALLFLAAFVGKLIGAFLLVPLGKLTAREALIIGVGINARLTTEIIVAKLLLDAGLIQTDLFTALVAASSLSTLIVPVTFTLLVRRTAGGPETGAPAVSHG